MREVLTVNNISVRFGRNEVLRGASLPALRSGEIMGLLGPNAAGKSTLMRCISGEQKYSGEICLNDRPYPSYSHREWHSRMAFMPQTPPQPSSLMPWELLWSAARALSLELSDLELSQSMTRLFSCLGLSQSAHLPLYSLSGGKRQLVGLALALIREPELLILDEPTSALDLHWRMVVLNEVRQRMQQGNHATVAVLHDLDLAARYCDSLVLLNQGHIVAAGSPAEVLTPENIATVYQVEAEVEDSRYGYPLVHIRRPLGAGA